MVKTKSMKENVLLLETVQPLLGMTKDCCKKILRNINLITSGLEEQANIARGQNRTTAN